MGVDSCTQTTLEEFDVQSADVIIVPTVDKKTRSESSTPQPTSDKQTNSKTPKKNQAVEQVQPGSSKANDTHIQSSQPSLSSKTERKAAKKAAEAASKETADPSGTSGRGHVTRGQSPEQQWSTPRSRGKNRKTEESSDNGTIQPMDIQDLSAESNNKDKTRIKPILPPK